MGSVPSVIDVQLLTLAKPCICFLLCAVLLVSLSLSKSISFSKMESGGHSNSFGGGARPANAPPWHRSCIALLNK